MKSVTPLVLLVVFAPTTLSGDQTGESAVTSKEVDALMEQVKPGDRFPPIEVLQSPRGAGLFVEALRKQPDGPWAHYLALWYANHQPKARMLPTGKRQAAFAAALVHLKNARAALERTEVKQSGDQAGYNLLQLQENINTASIEAGVDFDEVKKSAELMLQGNTDTKSWNYGNIIFKANTVLGRVALRENRRNDAKDHLIKSGKTPGSPQLNSFGPDFILAAELLEIGERDAVLEFLDLVSKFWANPDGEGIQRFRNQKIKNREQLTIWRQDIEEGMVPDSPRWR